MVNDALELGCAREMECWEESRVNSNQVFFRCSEAGELRTAFVTFKDPKALEIALLLSVY